MAPMIPPERSGSGGPLKGPRRRYSRGIGWCMYGMLGMAC